jgi:CTP synthase
MVDQFKTPTDIVRIAMCGKYAELADCYVSVNEALRHSGAKARCKVKIDWLETEIFEEDQSKLAILEEYDGVIVPGGFGQRGAEGKILAINYCRVNDKPFLGICYGFQLSTVEISRNILGLEGAASTECLPDTPHPVIDLLPEQKKIHDLGGTMRLGAHSVIVKEGTLAHKLYGATEIQERHRHRWEVNPDYWKVLDESCAVYSGWSKKGELKEILELPYLYYFLATQFHPEFKSRPWDPSPPYYGLVKASYDKKKGKPSPEF